MKRLFAMFLLGIVPLIVAAGPERPLPSASEQLRRLKSNQTLLKELLSQSLKLSRSESSLDRAIACRHAVNALANELHGELEHPYTDKQRVVELSGHVQTLVHDALVPNLADARNRITPASAEFPRYEAERDAILIEMARLHDGLPLEGKLAHSQVIATTRAQLTTFDSEFRPK